MQNWKKIFENNWKSGLTVAVINIPLSIALAVSSGGSPIQGLITGIWAGVITALFASSPHNVFGVAGALSSILLSFVILNGDMGPALLPLIALCSGFIILIVYLLKITKYITLLPSTVLHGFLISVGITIALGQISGALGLNAPSLNIPVHKEIYLNIWEAIRNIGKTNMMSLFSFLGGLSFLVICRKKFPNFPSVIVLSVIGIMLGLLVHNHIFPSMLLLSDKFQNLDFQLFQFSFLHLRIHSLGDILNIVKSIFTTSLVVAIIAILETIISAKIAQKITKVKFNKEREVLGLALANIGCGLLGGLPATAVFIRTALNIKTGANHKIAGFLNSIFTLLIALLLFNGFFKFLPFSIISAILMNIAIGLIDIKLLKKLYSLEKTAFFITLLTAVLSVLIEPIYGILTGVSISLLIFIKRVTAGEIHLSVFRDGQFFDKITLKKYLHMQMPGDVVLFKFVGGLNYLNTENHLEQIECLDKHQKVIISCTHMGDLDIDGVETFSEMVEVLRLKGIDVYLSGLSNTMEHILKKTDTFKTLSQENKIIESNAIALEFLVPQKV